MHTQMHYVLIPTISTHFLTKPFPVNGKGKKNETNMYEPFSEICKQKNRKKNLPTVVKRSFIILHLKTPLRDCN